MILFEGSSPSLGSPSSAHQRERTTQDSIMTYENGSRLTLNNASPRCRCWSAIAACALTVAVGVAGCASKGVNDPSSKLAPEATEIQPGSASDDSELSPAPEDLRSQQEAAQEGIQSSVDETMLEKRREVTQEAVNALSKTQEALLLLEEDKPEEALEALAIVVGQLEIVLERDPGMAFAVTGAAVEVFDLLATLDSVQDVVNDARDALDDGEVQVARELLSALSSEAVVTVTGLPLATYPQAIKEIVPLIDAGKIEEAKQALSTALNTLVVTEYIVPLPIVRAQEMLAAAEVLAEKPGRSAEENGELASLLENARYQIQLAEALGYGTEDSFAPVFEQIEEIEERTSDGKSGSGFFDKIKDNLSRAREAVFDRNGGE